ncbi:bifunctional riboflavin kinase/FAD synthetase [Cytobacillus sp. Hz8]|uniref:bifunctional riboflavin kinase/FAD synthetase n=1 Tax=Cytobacillus sp. Hz8 TaxID=3347168 RepID=UPI0035D58950
MEVITIDHPHEFNRFDFPPLAMALGYFDGVHLGHQKVILTAKEKAEQKNLKSSVMTFDPHPSVVLGNRDKVEYITPLKEKIKRISDLGVDYLFVVHFSADFANLLPQEFVDHYLIGLHVEHVVAGFDFTYGRMGKGNMETLPFHSRNQFEYTTVSKLSCHNEKISSTLIKNQIKAGRLEIMPELLGCFYTTSGLVIHGDHRGRTIGFPTANVDISEEYILPPLGVYAVRMKVGDKWYIGVCNVGYKPTFHEERIEKPSIEVHIMDFNRDIYGMEASIQWHKHLRSEKKFSGIDALVSQIQLDKEQTVEYFEKNRG